MAEANFVLNNSFNGDVTATNFSLDSSLLEELDTEFVNQKEHNNVRFRPPVSVDLISEIQDSTKPENTRRKSGQVLYLLHGVRFVEKMAAW